MNLSKQSDMLPNLKRIFVADDDEIFRNTFEMEFEDDNAFSVKAFASGRQLLECLPEEPDVVILDYYLNSDGKGARNGLELMERIKRANPSIPVIVFSSQESVEVATCAVQHGAFDYIAKNDMAMFRLRKTLSAIVLSENAKRRTND